MIVIIIDENDDDSGRPLNTISHILKPTQQKFTNVMKTPERWRALPRRALIVSILAQKVVKGCQYVALWRHMTSWHCAVTSGDVTTLLHMTSYYMTKRTCTDQPIWKSENHVFQPSDLDLWPMTLTFELIRDIVKVNPSTKSGVCTFNGSAGKALTDEHTDTQKHRHTDRRDRFHTLDRWRGREWSWVATWASNQFNMQVDLGKYCILNQLGQKLDRKVETLSTALSQQSRFFNCRHIPTALSTEIISKIMILSQDLLTDIQSILPYAWIS